MAGVVFLTAGSGPCGGVRTVAQLARVLHEQFTVTIVHVGTIREPNADLIAKVPGDAFVVRLSGPFDLTGYRLLRDTVRKLDPEVIHAVGPFANRIAPLLAHPGFGAPDAVPRPVVASAADQAVSGVRGWWTRKTLHGADRVIARTEVEAARYRGVGVAAEKIVLIPPGIDSPTSPDATAFRRTLGIPEGVRLIFAAGRFDRDAALKDAAWAFDVLKYVTPDLHLVLVGDGPERERVEHFAHAVGSDDYRVRFAGFRADLPSLFALADLVWVTHRRGGVATALEAMAAGKPVVAVGTPDLAAVVADGVTGVLVPPGDRVRMAAVTAELLAQPDRAAALGAAGRAVAERFSVAAMAERYAAVYHDVVLTS